MIVRIERNVRGPRLYVLGRRIHECHLGLAVLAALAAVLLAERRPPSLWTGAVAAVGAWMVVKDWRDLVPSLRDTGAWRVGLHRRFAPLRALRYADGLPTFAGAVAFAVGVVNLVSALTPNLRWRGRLLLQVLPVRAVPLFHTLAVPLSVALVAVSFGLRGRRRRAWRAALLLLVGLGWLNLLKGLDVEEALLSWSAAAVLWWGRAAFVVRHERLGRRSALWRLAGAALVLAAAAAVLAWLASGRTAEPGAIARQTIDLFAWTRGSIAFHDELSWVPLAIGIASLAVVLLAGRAFFRPLQPPAELPGPSARDAAYALVRAHGSDTLAFFKLRRDMHYLFLPDGRAFAGYRVDGNVLLVAGDPVGPEQELPALVREACAFAEERGLRVAALGASERLVGLWRQAGLNALYIGDEAVVETGRFSLEGRAVRKVRQSVTRLERDGYAAELLDFGALDERTLAELERVSALWRGGAPERGFAMAMDSLEGDFTSGSVVVVARDADGAIRGFLHFVPAFGRPAMSLSFMRRDRATPNGLTEFLVVRSIELLRSHGIEELSLNFAAFGRLLERPGGRLERLLGRLVALGSRYFQIESLYRFNAKFSPRWEPRYLVFEGSLLGLPRAGLAAMRVEGQLPRLLA